MSGEAEHAIQGPLAAYACRHPKFLGRGRSFCIRAGRSFLASQEDRRGP